MRLKDLNVKKKTPPHGTVDQLQVWMISLHKLQLWLNVTLILVAVRSASANTPYLILFVVAAKIL